MKDVIPALTTYRTLVDNATVTGNLKRRLTHFTGAIGQTLTLPNPKSSRKEFVIVNTSANTVTVAAPTGKLTHTTTVGGDSASVTTGTSAVFRAVAGMWYWIS